MQEVVPLAVARHRQTWWSIHEAAASAAVEHGPDGVTTTSIAAQAGISPRTFFNYFATKEDAILGVAEPVLGADAVAEFLADRTGTPLLRVSRLMAGVVMTALSPGVDLDRRLALVRRHDSLRHRLISTVIRSRDVVLGQVLTPEGPRWWGDTTLPQDEHVARALVLLASTTMTVAWQSHKDRAFPDNDAALTSAIDTVAHALEGSL